MPILASQPDIFPDDLLTVEPSTAFPNAEWMAASTRPRCEKRLMKRLKDLQIPHYCPLIEKRYRSPAGRFRKSYLPLFQNYVFLVATDEQRYQALTTDYILRTHRVDDPSQLQRDLTQIRDAIDSGIALTPESQLDSGQRVVVVSGHFRGYEGQVIRREGKTRLLLIVDFLEQGVSMEMDECQLRPL